MEKTQVSYAVGIGGWEHEALDHCFYPKPNAGSLEKLSYYSRFFDTVEVRSTFWDEALTADDAQQWIAAVKENKRFTFAIKLHSLFTHKKTIKPQLTKNVRGILQELAKNDRLTALLVQLPYSFTNISANRFHLVKLGEIFNGFPVHVEFRHDSWNQPTLMNFLSENRLCPVSADFPRAKQYMPFITNVVGDTAYLRLHGRNEKGWLLNNLDTRYDYLYNAKELREISRRLDALAPKCKRVIVLCNNTTQGKAVATALQITSALREGKHVLLPQATLRAFPHLDKIASVVEHQDLIANGSYRQAM